ncbi:hypothetical protein ACFX12_014573 [Malus domestica]
MLARACDSLSTEHWPLAMETFPARVKRDEHQKIVERSWLKYKLMVASHLPQEASSEQELHTKKSKVKIWTNYTPTPTYPKTIDNKNLAGKLGPSQWEVRSPTL